MLIDTHCHLDSGTWPEGAEAVLERARSAGVTGFVAIGVGSVAAAREAVALAERRPDVVAAVGVHPHDARGGVALAEELEREFSRSEVVAIGETGLDYHYDLSPREEQAVVFRWHVDAARRYKKPLVIHTRSASADTLTILEEERAHEVGGIIHCFSEDRAFAQRALDLGFDLSFSGIVTFKKTTAIQDVAAWVPSDRILVETDSPYLAPIPQRGKKCEPAYVLHTARFIAGLRNIPFEELCRLTSDNATRRFGYAFGARLDARGARAQTES
jgi:TatD DNase family protein